MPSLLDVSPPLLLASQPAQLQVSGLNLLQNDCQLLLRLQGRYLQPAAAHCGSCACQAPVLPGSDADPATRAAAAVAAASFEQRCCGCCTRRLQLVGLVPPPAAPAAPAVAASPSCCSGHGAAEPAATGSGSTASSRRVSAGAARVQSVRLLLPGQSQGQGGAEGGLLPGLLHLDVQRRAYTAPKGEPPKAAARACLLNRGQAARAQQVSAMRGGGAATAWARTRIRLGLVACGHPPFRRRPRAGCVLPCCAR